MHHHSSASASVSSTAMLMNGDELIQESFTCVLNQLAGTFSPGTNQNAAVSPPISPPAFPSLFKPSPISPPSSCNATTLSLNLLENHNPALTPGGHYFDMRSEDGSNKVSQSHQSCAWSTSTTDDCLSHGSSGSGSSPVTYSNQISPFEPSHPAPGYPGDNTNGFFGSFSLFSMKNDGLGGQFSPPPIGCAGQQTASLCDALSSYAQTKEASQPPHNCASAVSRSNSSSSGSSNCTSSYNSDRRPQFQIQGQGLNHMTSVRPHTMLNTTHSTPTKVSDGFDPSYILEFAEMRRALSLVARSTTGYGSKEELVNALKLNTENTRHESAVVGRANSNPWMGSGLQPQQPPMAHYANEATVAVEPRINAVGNSCDVGPGVPHTHPFVDPGKTAGQYSNPGSVGNPPLQMVSGGSEGVENNDQQKAKFSKVDTGGFKGQRSKSLGDGYDLYWSNNKNMSSGSSSESNPMSNPGDGGKQPNIQHTHQSSWAASLNAPRKHSGGSTWLPSELTGRHIRNSFVEPGSGMRELSYDEMMELTERQLERHGVTKGARNKIVISIRKLKERYNILRQFEDELTETGKVRTGLMEELRSIVSTPMRQFPPLGKPVADQRLIDGIDVDPSELDCNNLPAHFTRVAWKAGSLMLSNASFGQSLDEDGCSALLHILDRCSYHEAFTSAQKRKLSALKRQLLRVWRPTPRRARTWQGQHYHHQQQRKASYYNPTPVGGPEAVKNFNSRSYQQQCTVMTPVCQSNSLAAASTTVPTTSQLHYGCTQNGTNNSSVRLMDVNPCGNTAPHYSHQQHNPCFLTNGPPLSSDPQNPHVHHNNSSLSQDHHNLQSTTPPVISGIVTPPKSPEVIWRSHAGAVGDKRRPLNQLSMSPSPLKASADLIGAASVKDPWRTPLDICSVLANVYITSSEGFGDGLKVDGLDGRWSAQFS